MITHAQLQEIADRLAEMIIAAKHARIFVTSRERIKDPEGSEGYDAAVVGADAALAIIRSALATASPSESGDGDAKELPAPANETRGGTGDDCSVGKRGAWPPQGGESSRPLVKACDDEGLTARRDGTLPASDWEAGDLDAVPSHGPGHEAANFQVERERKVWAAAAEAMREAAALAVDRMPTSSLDDPEYPDVIMSRCAARVRGTPLPRRPA